MAQQKATNILSRLISKVHSIANQIRKMNVEITNLSNGGSGDKIRQHDITDTHRTRAWGFRDLGKNVLISGHRDGLLGSEPIKFIGTVGSIKIPFGDTKYVFNCSANRYWVVDKTHEDNDWALNDVFSNIAVYDVKVNTSTNATTYTLIDLHIDRIYIWE